MRTNACCVNALGSKAARPASERSEKRSVRLVLNANRAAALGRGRVCRAKWGGRDSASPICSDSSMPAAAAGLRRVGAWARSASPGAEAGVEVSDSNGLRSEAGQFRAGASRQAPRSKRKLSGFTKARSGVRALPGEL